MLGLQDPKGWRHSVIEDGGRDLSPSLIGELGGEVRVPRVVELQRETELAASTVIQRAVRFFGPEGWGMAASEVSERGIHFVGGSGGDITIEVVEKGDGGGTPCELIVTNGTIRQESSWKDYRVAIVGGGAHR